MFNKIIKSNEFVIENAKYIKINNDAIKKFAENIKQVIYKIGYLIYHSIY